MPTHRHRHAHALPLHGAQIRGCACVCLRSKLWPVLEISRYVSSIDFVLGDTSRIASIDTFADTLSENRSLASWVPQPLEQPRVAHDVRACTRDALLPTNRSSVTELVPLLPTLCRCVDHSVVCMVCARRVRRRPICRVFTPARLSGLRLTPTLTVFLRLPVCQCLPVCPMGTPCDHVRRMMSTSLRTIVCCSQVRSEVTCNRWWLSGSNS